MTATAPSGVVTFLFTDVEGSTRRWEADADGMRAALATHDEVLRSAIEAAASRTARRGDSFRNHCARHFPVQQVARATYRAIVERRALRRTGSTS